MVVVKESIPTYSKVGFKTVGISLNVRTTLVAALAQHRVVVGMSNAIRSLTEEPQKFLFCFMAPTKFPDSGTHMQQVLLEAFCFENDIYIIKVDSAEKLGRLLGSSSLASCALVRKCPCSSGEDKYTRSENILIDHCEFYWDEPTKPVIKLPDK
ncbi:growth arrest and DNA damage-inducible protein GADD45 alpha-like [Toxorhynchites rutilus septentrionalis]|uniref:growth arrest and DNA damage-inducible protein GADD45 alpha-like n=1 Tax=Toxorhynchites rutilus septentrionalis TaxID=329112 RepID=UPI00247AAD28|nr:growth arrest and DNA damage-inducible protein GADD45 alpha-like [Toxorhynchites rutilus septentrionalis]